MIKVIKKHVVDEADANLKTGKGIPNNRSRLGWGNLSPTLPLDSTQLAGSLTVDGTLTSAQILALNATPIVLIPAPGAGFTTIIDEIELFLDYGSAGYVAGVGEDLTIQYATSNVVIAAIDNDTVAFLTASADAHWLGKVQALYDVQVAGTGDGVLLEGFDNEAVEVTVAAGEVAGGNSSIKYRIHYHIINMLT